MTTTRRQQRFQDGFGTFPKLDGASPDSMASKAGGSVVETKDAALPEDAPLAQLLQRQGALFRLSA